MNEIARIPAFELKGTVDIKTFDYRTGMRMAWERGHNLFTDYGQARFRDYCVGAIAGQFGNGRTFAENDANDVCLQYNNNNMGILKNLITTDNTASISASDRMIPGSFTAYAKRGVTASSAGTLGSYVVENSYYDRTKIHAEFQFLTTQGNGTHGSIFWSDAATTDLSVANPYTQFQDATFVGKMARTYTYVAESSDGYLYGCYNATLYKIDPATLEELTTYTLSTVPVGGIFDVSEGLCVYNTGHQDNTLRIYDLSSQTESTMSISAFRTRGGAILDGYLYYPYFNSFIYKVDLSAKTSTSISVSLPSDMSAIFRNNGSLYWEGSNSDNYKIYTLDYANATLTATGFYGSNYQYTYNTHSSGGLFVQRSLTTYYNGTSSVIGYTLLRKPFPSGLGSANMITGKVLDSPVTKNDGQTMTWTYEIQFV